MNLKRVTRSFTAEDWLLIGYLVGIGLFYLCRRWVETAESSTARTDSHQQVGGYDHVELGEQALSRIEQGDSVTVDRWHGGTVYLKGDVVVDVEEATPDDAEDNDE